MVQTALTRRTLVLSLLLCLISPHLSYADDGFRDGTKKSPAKPAQPPPQKQSPTEEKSANPAADAGVPADILGHTESVINQIRGIGSEPPSDDDWNSTVKQYEDAVKGTVEEPAQQQTNIKTVPAALAPTASARPVLSLIVNAEPTEELRKNLQLLRSVAKSQRVRVGQVVLANSERLELVMPKPVLRKGARPGSKDSFIVTQAALRQSSPLSILTSMKFVQRKSIPTREALEKLDIEFSPTWVVSYQGKNYIFEGYDNPSRLFTANGAFDYSPVTPPNVNPKSTREIAEHLKNASATQLRPQAAKSTSIIFSPMRKSASTQIKRGAASKGSAVRLRAIPNCLRPNTRRIPVASASPMSSQLDIVFYSASDPAQVSASKNWRGRAVAYSGGSEVDKTQPRANISQLLAGTTKVACLPTRFRIVNEGAKAYLEYREGTNAWSSALTQVAPAPAVKTPPAKTPPKQPAVAPSKNSSGRF